MVCVGCSVDDMGVGSCRWRRCRSASKQVGFRFGWVGWVPMGLVSPSLGCSSVGWVVGVGWLG